MSQSLSGWTIVFDLDGTLVDSAPDLLNATNHVLSLAGRPAITLEQIRHMIGSGAKAMIRKGFELTGGAVDDEEVENYWSPFIAHYQANIAVDSTLFPGCEEALQELQARGAVLAVCTNKLEALAKQVLLELSVDGYFAACLGADSVPDKKPNGEHILATLYAAGGDRSRAIMIGDSETDEKAARNAGLPFIFVPFGYGPGSPDQVFASAVVNNYSDLADAIEAITN